MFAGMFHHIMMGWQGISIIVYAPQSHLTQGGINHSELRPCRYQDTPCPYTFVAQFLNPGTIFKSKLIWNSINQNGHDGNLVMRSIRSLAYDIAAVIGSVPANQSSHPWPHTVVLVRGSALDTPSSGCQLREMCLNGAGSLLSSSYWIFEYLYM